MAAGMAWEQSAGVLRAVLAEEGSATDKVLGSLGLLVMSIIIGGVKAKHWSLASAGGPRHHRMPSRRCAGRKETPL
jgi:hypothetical protein